MEKLSAKKLLRRQGIKARRGLLPEARKNESAQIRKALLQDEGFRQARSIFCYVSLEDEVHTMEILEAILDQGKQLSVPYITDSSQGRMKALEIKDLADLVRGEYGIYTVASEDFPEVLPEDMDYVIVPGTAFDSKCHRIGMGGGYYDRFLRDTKGVKVALAYDVQLLQDFSVEEHDISMDYIFTGSKILKK